MLVLWYDWMPDGQERTFSHGTSPDLLHWTWHRPVLSITDEAYPDGQGRFQDRNIWAPHVIPYDGVYYLFYTSVNRHVSQSISLATSANLFHWTPHPQNPVFTLEGVEWANWERDRWADCRDPMVLRDGERFLLYVTAQAAVGDPIGLVAVAESTDLLHWKNPRVALRGPHACESPQVWKSGERYYMTTSAFGQGCWESADPVGGWKPSPFPRPPITERERFVSTSPSYAEEVVLLDDGSLLIASLTFRHWGNTIYFFRVVTDEAGRPVRYESRFDLP